MQHLNIDIETYSGVDIKRAGAYKYALSPDFEVLLFAYAADGGPVSVVDIKQGENLPPEVLRALFDPAVTKHAYNAAFEWWCLSRWFGLGATYAMTADDWLPQWRCTMLHGLYCGYTAGLAATGEALGLPQDRRKLSTGGALIRTFCVPCKPTKANGGRVRTLPRHEPEKWKLFKEYCQQDVVTEREIGRRLSAFPVPDFVQRQWVTDLTINARGVAVDQSLVEGALWCADTVTDRLRREAVSLTGLDNPNSVGQLVKWLETEIDEEVPTLRKADVTDLLGRDLPSDTARRMLEIRQELGKTSCKKYDALESAVCGDGRVRGLLMFYGANRTGRWAGRIVQPQNLPQTHLPALSFCRDQVKQRDLTMLELVYGSVPGTLSQLIRTALVASPGNLLIDADFSAIEARVIAWLAGEEWVLEVFRTHGKIYEACASQMFGVPLESIAKGQENYSLRQKGKVATLALGYQGSTGALISMGALRMGLTEEELPDIVRRRNHTDGTAIRRSGPDAGDGRRRGNQPVVFDHHPAERPQAVLCPAVPTPRATWRFHPLPGDGPNHKKVERPRDLWREADGELCAGYRPGLPGGSHRTVGGRRLPGSVPRPRRGSDRPDLHLRRKRGAGRRVWHHGTAGLLGAGAAAESGRLGRPVLQKGLR